MLTDVVELGCSHPGPPQRRVQPGPDQRVQMLACPFVTGSAREREVEIARAEAAETFANVGFAGSARAESTGKHLGSEHDVWPGAARGSESVGEGSDDGVPDRFGHGSARPRLQRRDQVRRQSRTGITPDRR